MRTDDAEIPSNPLADISVGRRTWARRYIERRTSRFVYGSTEWLMLPTDHPDRIAACVAAAEAWAQVGDSLEEDLRREIAEMRRQHKLREDEEYQQAAEVHRMAYDRRYGRSFMDRRADQLEAARPRPDDYQGGPVEWNGVDGA